MRKDDIFDLVMDSYLELAERSVTADKNITDEQRAKQLDMVRRAISIYKEMYYEKEETYESRRDDLRKKR